MMKYIDANKIRAEIERLRKRHAYDGIVPDARTWRILGNLLSFLDTLQEPEQTCKTCGFYENNCPFIRGKLIPYPNKVCKDYTYSVVKAEQEPEVDLEKEIRSERKKLLDIFGPMNGEQSLAIEKFARHFYNLRKNTK